MSILSVFLRCTRFSPASNALLVVLDNAILASSLMIAFELPDVIAQFRVGELASQPIYLVVALLAVSVGALIGRVLVVAYITVHSEKALNRNLQDHQFEVSSKVSSELRRVTNHLGRTGSVAAIFWSSTLTCTAAMIYLTVFMSDEAAVGAIVMGLCVTIIAFQPIFKLSADAARGMRENRKLLILDEEDSGELSSFEQYYRFYFMRIVVANGGVVAYYVFLALAISCYLLINYMRGGVLDVEGSFPVVAIAVFVARLQAQAIAQYIKGAALTESLMAVVSSGMVDDKLLAEVWNKKRLGDRVSR